MVPKRKPRVFLDSNVIFSGLYSPRGSPAIILEHFIAGDISVVVSQQVLEEVVRTIKEKLPESLPALKKLLMSTPPEVTPDPPLEAIKRRNKKLSIADAAILEAAITARPDYFITGDNHFLGDPRPVEDTDLHIVTPAEFLKILKQM
jgi:putative PIN family toxin of toxin-antitoxin system